MEDTVQPGQGRHQGVDLSRVPTVRPEVVRLGAQPIELRHQFLGTGRSSAHQIEPGRTASRERPSHRGADATTPARDQVAAVRRQRGTIWSADASWLRRLGQPPPGAPGHRLSGTGGRWRVQLADQRVQSGVLVVDS
jgi:hypothetical protein